MNADGGSCVAVYFGGCKFSINKGIPMVDDETRGFRLIQTMKQPEKRKDELEEEEEEEVKEEFDMA